MILVLWFLGSIPLAFILAILTKTSDNDIKLLQNRPLTDDELARLSNQLRK